MATQYIPISIGPLLEQGLAASGAGAGAASDDPGTNPAADGGPGIGYEQRDGSRWNSLREGLRARMLFPEMMLPIIEKYYHQIAADLDPRNEYDDFIILEMARASAQLEAGVRMETADYARFLDRLRNQWPQYRSEMVDRNAARLPRAAEAAHRALVKTRQGAEYLVQNLQAMERTVAARGGLTAEQCQRVFDLMGIPPEQRDDPKRCPAGDDAVNLAAVIAAEIQTLETALETDLIAADRAERRNALNGHPVPPDAATRLLRANISRARRRLEWARGLLDWLRSGGSLQGMIDPETKKPITEAVAAHVAKVKAQVKKACAPTYPTPGPQPHAASAPAGAVPDAAIPDPPAPAQASQPKAAQAHGRASDKGQVTEDQAQASTHGAPALFGSRALPPEAAALIERLTPDEHQALIIAAAVLSRT
jgi:hypothetical protein